MRRHARAALLALCISAALTPGAPAFAADAVVVAATASGYTPGQRVPDGASVRLPDGGSVQVLFANGRTLTLKGPYDGPLDRQPAQAGNSRMTDMLGRPSLMQDELGASRAVASGGAEPLDLVLSTDRGPYPTYQPGDPVRLVVQTNRDAHLACMLRDGRGATTLLFPTAESGGSRVAGHAPLVLPGERMPMPLQASADQEVRCVAGDRDLTDALPRTSGLVPLTPAETEGLERALTVGAGRMVTGQVILRVDPR
ncbi:DUF4384 domain-containing protein [Azospirillum sp. sgz301742]